MNLNVKTTTTTIQVHTASLNHESVIEYLRSKGCDVPDNADVLVRVPGGGDWSNMDLEIGRDTPIFVTWKVRTET